MTVTRRAISKFYISGALNLTAIHGSWMVHITSQETDSKSLNSLPCKPGKKSAFEFLQRLRHKSILHDRSNELLEDVRLVNCVSYCYAFIYYN